MQELAKPNLFIIESLDFEDEQSCRFEGQFLSQILRLGGKRSAYNYIRTKKELQEILRLFKKSEYRYLHLSCHGVKDADDATYAIGTTLDVIPYDELARLMNPYLCQKRLFISACSVVNKDLAKKMIPSSECVSIIGPAIDIGFNDAAIVWASFYHLVFKADRSKMGRKDITATLKKVAVTFKISLNYFSASKEHGLKGDLITKTGEIIRIFP